MRGRGWVTLACFVTAFCAAATASASRDGAAPAQRVEVSVGYTSPAALRAAVSRQHAIVVSRVPALRIAHIRLAADTAARLSALPGIRFVQRVTQRADAGEPGLQAASGRSAAWEWQFTAAHEDDVPDWVLRAAGSITDVDEATAIAYAVDHGARILNLSFGGTKASATERSAIDYATSHGVLIVAAAGNHYLSGNPVLYPAALVQPLGSKGVGGIGLSVGASTDSGARAAFSNTGTYLSLLAPGDGVFSDVSSAAPTTTFPRVTLPGSVRGLYGYASGTSFAAPEVSGAAALVMAANPLLNAPEVAQVIKESASGRGEWTPELGYGVLDVGRAVELATGAKPELATADLKLVAHVVKHRVRLTARLSSLVLGVPTAARPVTFDRYDAKRAAWKRVATVRTRADGSAVLTVAAARKPLRFRARWSGAADLAPASSKSVAVRAR